MRDGSRLLHVNPDEKSYKYLSKFLALYLPYGKNVIAGKLCLLVYL